MNKYDNQHRYYTIDRYLKDKYQKKVFKVALNGNFSCPNRDGTISDKGCFFCSNKGSGDFAGDPKDTLLTQFTKIKEIISLKWPNSKYIVYFQANTNTYAPLEKLKKLFEEAITLDKDIVAISIATRPDCLNKEVIEYLSELNKRIPVWIELGLQTIHQKTADFINRGYNTNIFKNICYQLYNNGINTIVHIINGLPYETKEMMLATIKYLNILPINGIKIHSLYIIEDTILADIYKNKNFPILSLAEYVNIVCEQLALLRDDIVVHRINGDAPKEFLIEPKWSIKKLVVMNEIDKEMKKRDYFQGCKYVK